MFGIVVLVLALFVGLPLGIYFGTYASAGVRGAIAVHNTIWGPDNQITTYNHFFDLNAAYQSQVAQVPVLQSELATFNKQNPSGASDPFGQIANQRSQIDASITGLEQQCITNANQYNNDALKYTEAPFKDNNLPVTLSPAACS